MADEITIKVPDIGGATGVDVIEILVKPGDDVIVDTPLITLESDKASMEIPSTAAGVVHTVAVKLGDKISEGDVILTLVAKESSSEKPKESTTAPVEPTPPVQNKKPSASQPVVIPDIGGATDVDVIDVLVSPGDYVKKDQSLITLEGDKATMEIPSPLEGVIESIALKVGDKVSQGDLMLTMRAEGKTEPQSAPAPAPMSSKPEEETLKREVPVQVAQAQEKSDSKLVSAGPAVRRLARELGVNLSDVKGSGRKSRLTKEDIQSYVKSRLSEKSGKAGFSMPEAPAIDFSKFGEIETKPLNKIKKLTGLNVHRSWITIPHVTQFDEADITELDVFRLSEAKTAEASGYKLTVLAFAVKAVSKALMIFPQFNASLDSSGENLILKKYVHIGIAVETPDGLMVPVIKDVNNRSVAEIAIEMARLSKKAREKSITPADMSGGSFTISSLGGIGGTAFTPIVNSPEVAILGLSRSAIKPIYIEGDFKPRLMLPLSLSYDHRVIDGAEAARFTRYIAQLLGDIRRILL